MKLSKLWRQPPRSSRNRIRRDDLAPDGITIRVAWDKFVPGASVFVPCVNTVECVRQFHEVSQFNDWVWDSRIGIEGGRWGVRFWRVL
jgi:hypothetical protein